jgi:hypothetical protein
VYLLPLRQGTPSGKAEICLLDLARGKVHSRLTCPPGETPGNLLIRDPLLISQTATHLTLYPLPDLGGIE